MRFAAKGKKAGQDYFSRLSEKDISVITFYLPGSEFTDKQEKPYVAQSWLDDVGNYSDFYGGYRSLNDRSRAFRVSSAGVASAQDVF